MSNNKSFFRTNPFVKVFLREIRRMSSSKVYLFTTLIGPLISFIVLMAIFSNGVPSDIPIGVVDKDNTVLSRKISQWLDATSQTKIVCRALSMIEAKRELEDGTIQAIVFIPEGTEKEATRGSGQMIPVYINNTNIIIGGYIQKGIYKAIATLSGGIKLQIALKKGLTKEQAMGSIQPVRLDQHVLFNPFGNYAYFLLSALLPLMVVLFTLLSTVYAVGIEFRQGTALQWLQGSGKSVVVAVSAKLLPYTVLMLINMMVMNVILFVKMGTPLLGSFWLIIFGEITLIITYQMVSVLFVTLTSNLRLSLSLASAYAMMALTFAGLTFPQFAMPLLARIFAVIFPFTYWVRIFISQAFHGESIAQGWSNLWVFLGFILISVAFLPQLKRKLKTRKYWGRI